MNPQARYFAAAMKQNVAHFYAVSPRLTADQAVAGAMWEIADVIADEQGAREASETLYRIADAVARRLPIDAVFPDESPPQSEQENDIHAIAKALQASVGELRAKFEDAAKADEAAASKAPEEGIARAFITGFIDGWKKHWFGVAFLAFYAGLVIGRAM